MASTLDGVLEMALNSNWYFTDTLTDDFVIRTQSSNQGIAIGVMPNTTSAIYISSTAINLNKPVNIGGGFQITGQTDTYSNLTVGANATVCNNLLVFGSTTLCNPVNLQSNITVKGIATFSNNVYALNPTSLSNTLNVSGKIDFSNALTITSNLWVNGGASLSNILNVSGKTDFSNAVTITSNLWVNGATSLSNNLNVFGSATISNITTLQSNLVVAGTTTLSNNVYALNPTSLSNTLNVSGKTDFSNAVTITSNLWVNGVTSLSNNLNVFGSATVSNITTLQSNLVVAGTTTLSNNLYALNPTSLSNTLNVSGKADFSNALTVTSNLWVNGATSLSNTLNVSGKADFSNALTITSNLWVNGATSLSNNLNVYGTATICNNTTLQGSLVVTGAATFSNNLYLLYPVSFSNSVNFSGIMSLSNALTVTSNLIVLAATSLSNNLNVYGTATICNVTALQSNLIVAGITTFSNNVYALNPVSLSNTLNVSGKTDFSNAVTVTSNLWVNGTTSLSNTLNVFGSATISNVTALQSNLVVAGIATFSNQVNTLSPINASAVVTISNAATVTSNLWVMGVTSLSNNLNVSSKADFSNALTVTSNLWVNGATSLSNTLNVSGKIDFSNALTITSNLWVNGATSLSNNLNVYGSATISNVTALQSNLVVAGTTTLSNNVYALNPTSLSNTLNVSGKTDFSNAVTITSNLWVNGTTSLSNTLNVSGITTFSNAVNLASNLDVKGLSYFNNNTYIVSTFSALSAYPPPAISFTSNTANVASQPYGNGVYNIVVSSQIDSFQPSYAPFDSSMSTQWMSSGGYVTGTGNYQGVNTTTVGTSNYPGEWIDITLPQSISLSNLRMLSGTSGSINYGAKDFYVVGSSNSGTSWDLLLSVTGYVSWSNGATSSNQASTFSVASANQYNRFRIIVNKVILWDYIRIQYIAFDGFTGSASFMGVRTSNPTEALDVIGNLKTSTNLYVMSNIAIGKSNPAFNLDISGSAFISGSVTLSNTLNVSGKTDFSNALTVTSNLWVNGATSLSNNLNVYGSATVSNVTALQSNLIVAGAATFSNTVTFLSNLAVMGQLTVSNVTYITSNILIYSSETIQSNLAVFNATTLCNAVNIYGLTTLCNNFITACNVTINSNLVIAGTTTLSNPGIFLSNLVVSGTVAFSNTSFHQGISTFSNQAIFNSNITLSNYGAVNIATSNNFLGINTTAPSEAIDFTGGNAKFSSNVYVGTKLAVGASNPAIAVLEVTGCNVGADLTAGYFRNIGSNNSNNLVTVVFGANQNSGAIGQAKLSIGNENLASGHGFMAFYTTSNSTSIERARLTSSGFLGIGTSNPNKNLHVYSSLSGNQALFETTSNTGSSFIQFKNYTSSVAYVGVDGVGYGDISRGALMMSTWNEYPVLIATSNQERARFTSDGLLGVGISNPSYKMDVVSGTGTGTASNTGFRVWTQTSNTTYADAIVLSESAGQPTGKQAVTFRSEAVGNTFVKSRIWSQVGTSFANAMMGFDVADASKTPQTRMVIDVAGNVGFNNTAPTERLQLTSGHAKFDCNVYVMTGLGIGTSNLTQKVNIVGTTAISGTPSTSTLNTGSTASYILMSTTDNNTGPGLAIQNIASNNQAIYFDSYYNSNEIYSTTQAAFSIAKSNSKFMIRNATGGVAGSSFNWNTAAITVLGTGSVGINTETPSEKLDVQAGNAKFGCNVYIASNLGIGLSNPQYTLDISGDINFTGVLNKGGSPFVGSRWTSNTQGIYYNYAPCNVGIGTSTLSEKFTVDSGNAKFGCNVYMMSNVGIGKSNPAYSLDVTGTAYVSGAMIHGGVSTFSNAVSNLGLLTTVGAATFQSTVTASNVVTMQSNLIVQGQAFLSNFATFCNVTTMLSNLVVNGPVTFSNTLNVTGAVTMSNVLSVSNVATFTSNIIVQGSIIQGGAVTMCNPMTALSNMTIQGTLNVSNVGTFSSNVIIQGQSIHTGFAAFSNTIITLCNLGVGSSNPSLPLVVVGSNGGIVKIGNNTTNTGDKFWIGFNQSNSVAADTSDIARIGVESFISSTSTYPPTSLTANTTAISGQAFGNGTYVASASTTFGDPTYAAYHFFSTDNSWWASAGSKYNTTTGAYSGSVSTTVSGSAYLGEWAQLQMPATVVPSSYIYTLPYQVGTTSAAKTWILAGSTDGSTWALLHSQSTVPTFTANKITITLTGIVTAYSYYRFIILSSAGGDWAGGDQLQILAVAGQSGSRIFFTTGVAGSQTERFRIDQLGNIGVGTSNPQYTLDVAGIVNASNLVVPGQATLCNNLNVNGAVAFSNTLGVSNVATFTSNVLIQGTSVHTGNATFSNPTTMLSNLVVNGPVSFSNTLGVSNVATFLSNVNISGLLTVSNVTYVTSNVFIYASETIQSNLTVSNFLIANGAATFCNNITALSNVTILNTLGVSNVATFASNVFVQGQSVMTGNATFSNPITSLSNLAVNGAVSFSNTLGVSNVATFTSNVIMQGTSVHTGNATFSNPITALNNLAVNGAVSFSNTLGVSNVATFTSNVIVQGQTTLNGPVSFSNTLGVSNVATFTSNVLVQGQATVTGNATFSNPLTALSNFAVNGAVAFSNTLGVSNVATFTSNVLIQGQSVTTGNATFSNLVTALNNLAVNGAVSFSNTLGVSNVATFTSNVIVQGQTTMIGAASFSNTLGVSNVATFTSNVFVQGQATVTGNATFSNPVTALNNLAVIGAVSFSNTLGVSNVATFTSNVIVQGQSVTTGNATFSNPVTALNNLAVNGTVSFSNTLGVSNVATFTSNVIVQGQSVITGNATFSNPVTALNTLAVNGAVSFSNTLGVSNVATFTSNVIVQGQSVITGNATFSNPLTALSNLAVNGTVSFSNTLGVSNVATFTSNVLIQGQATVTGNTTFSNPVTALSNLAVNGTVSFSNTLGVSNVATFTSNVIIQGTSVHTGNATFSNPIIGLSNLSVNGPVSFSNTMAVSNVATFLSNVNISGLLSVSNVTYITSNIFIYASETVQSNLTVSNFLIANGAATFCNNITSLSNMTILGMFNVSNVGTFTSNVIIKGTSVHTGLATFSNTIVALCNLGVGSSNPSLPLVVVGSNGGIVKIGNNTANSGDKFWIGFNQSNSVGADASDIARIGVESFISSASTYPSASLTANSTVISGQAYGNGTYVASASTTFGDPTYAAYHFFSSNNSWWASGAAKYNTSTGAYLGSVSTTVSGSAYLGEWAQIQMPTTIVPSSYIYTYPYQVGTTSAAKTWILAGSTDGSTWTLLHSQSTVPTFTANKITITLTGVVTAYSYFRFIILSSAGGDWAGGDQLQILTLSGQSGSRIFFTTGVAGSQTERIRIDQVGNVGVGTSNPQYALDVVGGASFSSNVYAMGRVGINTTTPLDFFTIAASNFSISNYGRTMVFGSNNNLGLGTQNPLTLLHVSGDTTIDGNLIMNAPFQTRSLQIMKNTTSTPPNFAAYNAPGVSYSGGSLYVKTSGSNAADFVAFLTGSNPNSEKMRITGTGLVGIGTQAPAYALDVAGVIRSTGSILGGTSDNSFVGPYVGSANLGFVKQSGSAARICYNNANPFKIAMMNQADITQNIATATYTDRIVIDNSGNIGINTSSPGSYNLDVSGTARVTSTFTGPGGISMSTFLGGTWLDLPTAGPSAIGSGGAGQNAWIGYAQSAGNWFSSAAVGDICYRNTSGKVLLGTNINQHNFAIASSYVYSSNNIGIGVSNVTNTLTVSGNASIGSGYTGTAAPANGLIVQGNTGIGSSAPTTLLHTTSNNSNMHLFTNGSNGTGVLVGIENVTDTNGGFNALLWNNSNAAIRFGTSNVERMRITSNGRIGMGTSNPVSALHISSAAATTESIAILVNSTNSNFISLFSGNSTDTNQAIVYGSNTDLRFGTWTTISGASWGEKMRLTTVGNLGIGTQTPSNILTVSGGASVGSTYNNVLAPTNGLIVQGNVGIGNSAPGSMLSVAGGVAIGYSSAAAPTNGMLVQGVTTLCNNLAVFGSTTFSNPVVMYSNLTVNGILSVSNVTYVTSNIVIYNNEIVQSNLNVYSAATMCNALTIYGTTIHSNITVLSSNLTFSNFGAVTLYTSNSYLGVGISNPSYPVDFATGPMRISAATSNKGAIFLTGTSYYSTAVADATAGVQIALGYNATANRQIMLMDSAASAVNSTNIAMRLITGVSIPVFDAITTDNSAVKMIQVGNTAGTYFTGNIGYGTTSTSESVHSTAKIYSQVQLLGPSNDSATVPSHSWKEDSNTGMFHASNDAVGFTTNGAERMRITDSGNVGIGIVNPATILHVQAPGGEVRLDASNTYAGYSIVNNSNGAMTLGLSAIPGQYSGSAGSNDVTLRATSTIGKVHLQSGVGSAALTVNSNNYIGIGTSTPQRPLEIYNSSASYLRISGPAATQQGIEFYDTASRWIIYKPGSGTDLRWWNGTADVMTMQNGGNIGIGTSSPGSPLTVNSTSTTVIPLSVTGSGTSGGGTPIAQFYNSNSQPCILIGSTSSSNLYINYSSNASLAQLGLYGGSFAMSITPTNLGLGTTTPHSQSKLHIAGAGVNNQLHFSATDAALNTKNWAFGPNGATFYGYIFDDAYTGTANWIQATRSANTVSTVSFPNGNVGVGTTAPGYKLDVNGSICTNNNNVVISGGITTDGTYGIYWNSNDTSYAIYRSSGAWSAPNYQQLILSWTTGIIMNPGTLYGKSYVDIQGGGLRVTSGNVGIGTTSPAQKMHIAGTSGSDTYLRIDSGGTNSTYSGIMLCELNVNYGHYIRYNSTSDNMEYGYNNGTSLSTYMTTTYAGNVGIGTTTPSYKLDVAGDLRISGDWYWGAGKNYILNATGNGQEWSFDLMNQNTYTGCYWQVWSDKTNNSILVCRGDTMNVGIGTSSPGYKLEVSGAIYASGDITALSDKRFKEDIRPVTNALDTVNSLQGYSYTRKDYESINEEKGTRHIGLIAQDVKEVIPEVVTYDTVNDKYGINYGSMAGIFIEAIKDLKKKVESLETIVEKQSLMIQKLINNAILPLPIT